MEWFVTDMNDNRLSKKFLKHNLSVQHKIPNRASKLKKTLNQINLPTPLDNLDLVDLSL